ncbi:sialate O-acetylesterase [Niabella terrae]
MRKYFVLILGLLAVLSVQAEIRLPAVIGNHMVLQQKVTTRLWGWAAPSEKIFITTSWNNQTDSTTATGNADWELELKTPAAGGPYTITLKGRNTIVLEDIMVGEVWVCSGQSNMEWGYRQNLQQIKDELPVCYNKNIRLFNVERITSATPQDDCRAAWAICDSNSLKAFSAIGYFFGKKLNSDMDVPIGLINTNWGGTPAEVWTPREAVEKNPELLTAANKLKAYPWWPTAPGRTYNTMIAPLIRHQIAGAIWYQGEANTETAATYSELLNTMIGSWRKAWGKDFPFYYVQIAPFKYGDNLNGALLREQQARSAAYPHTGMVVISDLVDDTTNIHPVNKKDVALRLANWALADTYHQFQGAYQSPVYKSMQLKGSKVILSFDHLPSGFSVKGKKITNLYIAGADRVFYPANARVDGKTLIVSASKVKNPAAVRYSFSNTAIGNVFSKEGLPLAPFRTDNWEIQ